MEEKIPKSRDTADDRDYSPPKKKKKRMESTGVSAVCTVKIRLLKPFVLKTDCIQQPGDDDEDEDDDYNDNEDEDDDDDEGGDSEDTAWIDGM